MVEWRSIQLGDLIDIKHGFAFKGEFFSQDKAQDVLVTPGNFAIGGGFQWGKQKFYDGPVPKDYVLHQGDLIVTMTDLSKDADTLGYAAIVPHSDVRLLHNQRIGKVVARSREGHLPFLHWLMRSATYRHHVVSSASGSTVKHTSPTRILNFQFLLPPLEEQQAIASVLGALDNKIDLNRRMNETLEAMARALFKDWFVDFGPTCAKMEGRAAYLAPDLWALFPDRLDDEGKPEGWDNEPLLDHAALISGGTPKTDVGAYWNGHIPWASAKDVSQCRETFLIDTERTITERGLDESSTRIVPRGATVVVARGATTGRYCMFGQPMAMNQTCYGIVTRSERPFWLNCAFGSIVRALVHNAHGSVFDTITTRTIEAARILNPGDLLLDAFEAHVASLFEGVLANIAENATLAATRDLLLPKLMSGEIRVRDAEKVLEPAL